MGRGRGWGRVGEKKVRGEREAEVEEEESVDGGKGRTLFYQLTYNMQLDDSWFQYLNTLRCYTFIKTVIDIESAFR